MSLNQLYATPYTTIPYTTYLSCANTVEFYTFHNLCLYYLYINYYTIISSLDLDYTSICVPRSVNGKSCKLNY